MLYFRKCKMEMYFYGIYSKRKCIYILNGCNINAFRLHQATIKKKKKGNLKDNNGGTYLQW